MLTSIPHAASHLLARVVHWFSPWDSKAAVAAALHLWSFSLGQSNFKTGLAAGATSRTISRPKSRTLGHILDGAVHPLDLSIGPGMFNLGGALLEAVLLAGELHDRAIPLAVLKRMPLSVNAMWMA